MLAVLLWACATAPAQTPPPVPSAPPQPATIVPAPYIIEPTEPMGFAFAFEGGSFLGIQPEEINRENMGQYNLSQPRGVGVRDVSKDGPAERAGLKKGDVILEFDGEAVTSTRKLMRLIGEAAPEQAVRLTILRNGSEQHLTATLGKRLAPRADASNLWPAEPPEFQFEFPPTTPPRPPRAGRDPESEVYAFAFGNRRVGILTTPLTKQLADYLGVSGGKGVLVTTVNENSPAAKAGLRAGDVITEVNGASVEDSGDFIRELNRKDDGEVTLTVVRDKSQRTIKVTPERRPATSLNLTDFQRAPMALGISPRVEVEKMYRVLQAMPKVESFALPKLQKLVVPGVINVPRLAPVPLVLDGYYD